MSSNAAELYKRISSNPEQTQALFRQALQDPAGAMSSICSLGDGVWSLLRSLFAVLGRSFG